MDVRRLEGLAVACQAGDERSFQVLVETMTRPLMAMAYRYTRDWEWARDLTQETWMRVFEGIDRYEPGRPFRSWLYAIHRNGCLSHVRRSWVRKESTPGDEVIWRTGAAPSGEDPQAALERREFHDLLRAAVRELSPAQRRVFLRVDVEGGQPKRVAESLGMKHGTLRTTLHFARKRLASSLRDLGVSP